MGGTTDAGKKTKQAYINERKLPDHGANNFASTLQTRYAHGEEQISSNIATHVVHKGWLLLMFCCHAHTAVLSYVSSGAR